MLAAVARLVADRAPRPALVAEAIGAALGAAECELVVDGVTHRWGAESTGAWSRARLDEHAELRVRPARRLGAVADALGPVPDLVRLALSVDELRRAGTEAAAELADTRWRAAAEMDTERRRVERDLHDGTQHHLVALRLAVALAEHDPASADLGPRLDAAEATLVRTAAGVLPEPLADGLAAALGAELGTHTDVRLDLAADLPRYPAPVETAVYFVCLEAVGNAHKHAVGASIDVRLRGSAAGLSFSVSDNGPGFEPTATGTGLANLTTRLTPLGGTLRVDSALGTGTTVEGFVPG
ncbi:histidine kinase/DNA gyrase B/HSP90-like ATPase [Actinokineospora auranticolor]|uniref:histidine kinase n=1 Tax=Actinokineospora auranticolor TaxID=155976 RepID=A0A2S6H0J9_9PSEU|nr:histidine kinase/DNA gyrase B/HSP90-like ATPase [Actinokineospora auranticolor]